ncbi:hypothetical protein CAMSH0001_0562 [Campylobacter showae RM3277]|uniref:Uncharacterized protein n=1 Tax=Campylobacter showae RM3277 TaxID=553219 RepID=C6RGB0_9BACT|nr:hypothetical protein CAMSH0001_0562 [Campylobacter showae RM3277]
MPSNLAEFKPPHAKYKAGLIAKFSLKSSLFFDLIYIHLP